MNWKSYIEREGEHYYYDHIRSYIRSKNDVNWKSPEFHILHSYLSNDVKA